MTTTNVEAMSKCWEAETGADSIPTIRRVYDRTAQGAIVCIWPGCTFARHDAVLIWRHVHKAHGTNSLPPDGYCGAS